jgi:hypothetical protein
MAVSATALKTKTAPKPKHWVWEARTRAGETKKGEMEALDAGAVDTRLKALGLSPVKVKKKPAELRLPTIGSGVSGKDILVFTKQFATMIDAGLPLVQCLDILANQMDNAAFKKVVLAIKAKVESGVDVRRRAEGPPQGLRRALHPALRRGRGGRHPRHHPQPAGELPGEGREAEAEGEGGDDLPGHRHHAWRSASPRSCSSR